MSSTNRGGQRNREDNYPTPTWCVRRLLEAVKLPAGRWLEPTAGAGAIIEGVNAVRSDIEWTAVELRDECQRPLSKLIGPRQVRISDFLEVMPDEIPPTRVVITNPPYLHAMPIVEHAQRFDAWVVMLLRLNFLSSETRAEFLRRNPPDVYVLPNRPSFTASGKTDSIEYAWFVWKPSRRGRKGSLQVLAPTSKEDRKSDPVNRHLARGGG